MKDLLKDLTELTEQFKKDTADKVLKMMEDDATLSIEKKGFESKTRIEGTRIAIITAFMVLERNIKEKLDLEDIELEMFRRIINNSIDSKEEE